MQLFLNKKIKLNANLSLIPQFKILCQGFIIIYYRYTFEMIDTNEPNAGIV